MYLVAVKSLYAALGRGKITIIDDGSLTADDRKILVRHLRSPTFVDRKNINIGRFLRHIMWERLAYAIDASAGDYIIQLDADTVTTGAVPEVLEAIAENRAFTLGTWNGQTIAPVAEARAYAQTFASDHHIQLVMERALADLANAGALRYVRGSAGLIGLARGGVQRSIAEDFYDGMASLVGDRIGEWGTDQVAFNFLVANSPGAIVLPYPAYACVGPELDVRAARFLHFIGTYRFKRGIYARASRNFVASAAA
jgi:hypothetical protein